MTTLTRIAPLLAIENNQHSERGGLDWDNKDTYRRADGESIFPRLLWRFVGAPFVYGGLVYLALRMSEVKGEGAIPFLWPANGHAIVHLMSTNSVRYGAIELALLMMAYILVVTQLHTHRSHALMAGYVTAHALEISIAVWGLRHNPLTISCGNLSVKDLKRTCLWGGLLGPLISSIVMSISFICFNPPTTSIAQDFFDGCILWCAKHAASNVQLIWSLTLIKHRISSMSVKTLHAAQEGWNIATLWKLLEFVVCLTGIVVATFFASSDEFEELYLISLLLVCWASYRFSQFIHAMVELFTFCFIISTEYIYTDVFTPRENAALNILLYTFTVMGCYVAAQQYETKTSFIKQQEQYMELQVSKEEIESKNNQSLLFAFMSHEFKTPLSIIIGFVHECRHLPISKQHDEYLCHIKSMAEDLLSQTSDTLDMLRLGAGKDKLRVETVNVHDVFRSSVTKLGVMGKANNVSISSYISPGVPRFILADRMRIEEVIHNLSGNAVKYSADSRASTNNMESRSTRGRSRRRSHSRSARGISSDRNNDSGAISDVENQNDASMTSQQAQCKMELLLLDDATKKELQNEGTIVLVPSFWHGTGGDGLRAPAIVLRVTDSGRGIPEALHKAIFSSYERVGSSTEQISVPGTGLGLAICKQLITKMKGGIHVRSAIGQGSTFSFILPLEVPGLENIEMRGEVDLEAQHIVGDNVPLLKESVNEKRQSGSNLAVEENENEGEELERHGRELTASNDEENDGSGTRSLHVLVVEDTPLNQKLIAAILRRQGHSYKIAGNGQIALDLLLENEATHGTPFDAIICDLFMPEMSGEEFLKARGSYLPAHLALLPVCVVSADVGPGVQDRLQVLPGVVGILEKPYRPAVIMALLATAAENYRKNTHAPTEPTQTPS